MASFIRNTGGTEACAELKATGQYPETDELPGLSAQQNRARRPVCRRPAFARPAEVCKSVPARDGRPLALQDMAGNLSRSHIQSWAMRAGAATARSAFSQTRGRFIPQGTRPHRAAWLCDWHTRGDSSGGFGQRRAMNWTGMPKRPRGAIARAAVLLPQCANNMPNCLSLWTVFLLRTASWPMHLVVRPCGLQHPG